MRGSRVLRHTAVALAMGAALVSAAPSGAANKPARDVIPAGATVLYFTSYATPSGGVTSSSGAITVTNVRVIDQIRSLINALPLSDPRPRVCPDDLLVPSYVSFAANAATAPFARVLFQLGGCPFARVYRDGVAESPTLGGAHLGIVFSEIKRLVDQS